MNALMILAGCLAGAQEIPRTAISDRAIQAQVAVGADDAIWTAFLHAGNVVVSVSRDAGKTFVKPVVAMDGKGRIRGGCQRGPRIGVDSAGVVTVSAPACFDEREFDRPYPRYELFAVRSGDGGATWTEPVRVNEKDTTASEALHWMAVAPNGEAHVAWLDTRGGMANCLWYARITDGNVGRNIRISGPVCDCCAPGLTVDGHGNPTIAVREGKKSDRAILLLRSRDVGRTFGPPVPVSTGRTGLGT